MTYQTSVKHLERVELVFPDFVKNQRLREWVTEIAQLTQPENIYWCDGSQAE